MNLLPQKVSSILLWSQRKSLFHPVKKPSSFFFPFDFLFLTDPPSFYVSFFQQQRKSIQAIFSFESVSFDIRYFNQNSFSSLNSWVVQSIFKTELINLLPDNKYILMRSLYYKVGPKGYQKTSLTPPPNINLDRRVPVYRVVNEFMNLDQEEQEQSVPENKQPLKFYVDIEHSAPSEDLENGTQIKFISRKKEESPERDQITSNYTQQSMLKAKGELDKQMSQRDLKNSVIKTVIKAKIKPKNEDGQSENITNANRKDNQRLMEFELEKQRSLRKNLQKSYETLLKKLKQKESLVKLDEQDLRPQHKKTVLMRSQTDRCNKIDEDFDADENQQMKRSQKMRKSCCNFQEDLQSDKEEKNQLFYPDYQQEEEFQHYFLMEKEFQNKLKDQILALRLRIQKIDSHLIKQQHNSKQDQEKMLTLQKQNNDLKAELHYQQLLSAKKREDKTQDKGLSRKEHFHYIFTIMIMFLCFAMFTKNKQ